MKFNKNFKEYLSLAKPVKTIIDWYDLYSGHYLKINPDFQKQIFGKAIKKAGDYSSLGRRLGIGRKTISGCFNLKRKPQIDILKKIADYCNYPLDKINCQIIEIAGLKPSLPFVLNNKEGAEIRAALISDGHIDKKDTSQCQYCALEKELHERLINLCKKTFGEFGSKTYFNNGSNVTKFPSVIGNSLRLAGIPKGNKMLSNFYIPKDILLAKEDIQASYLRRVFDDEGDVCFDNYGKRAVRLTRSLDIGPIDLDISSEKWVKFEYANKFKHNLIFGEQLLLQKLGIDARLYSEGVYRNKKGNITAKWRIQIGQQDQLKTFSKLINFNLSSKKEKLNKIILSYQFRKLPNGKGKEEALEFIKKTINEKGFIRFKDLGKELVRTHRTYDLAGRYLNYFVNKKIIKKIRRGIYTI